MYRNNVIDNFVNECDNVDKHQFFQDNSDIDNISRELSVTNYYKNIHYSQSSK